MDISLENDQIQVCISTLGAEIVSLRDKASKREYVWKGDAAYWTGHAPVLFPIVGGLVNGQYRLGDKTYEMKKHGFARRSEFQVRKQTNTYAKFRLKGTDETLGIYPFYFDLDITYELDGNQVLIDYRVRNLDDKDMPFQLGTHPSFMLTHDEAESIEDWQLSFNRAETLTRSFIEGTLLDPTREAVVLDGGHTLTFTPKDFYEDAWVFKNIESTEITLSSDKTKRYVKVGFENFPDLGIWQPKDAPFLCIEPWRGICDVNGFEGSFGDKHNAVTLSPSSSYKAKLTIEIG